MPNNSKKGVTTDQAGVIHQLLGEAFETSLRQQLLSGEFNAAMLGKIAEWLKHNNVSVVEEADERLASLASLFRNKGTDFNFLEDIESAEI